MIDDKYRPWINPSYFDDWKKTMDSPYYGKEIEMETAYNYEYKYDIVSEGEKICSLSIKGLLNLMDSSSNSKINMIKIWRTYPLELEPIIEWSTNNRLHKISATNLLTGKGKIRAMGALVHALYNHEYITTEMYDKYWDYMNEWPMDKYLVSICAEEKIEPESDKPICFVDQITGQKFYTSEQVAKSIAKQIADDISIPWGDTEGYSKYFKGGDMKINIHTGGIMSNDSAVSTYKIMARKLYGPVLNPGIVCYRDQSGSEYNDIRDVIKKVQINEKKKVVTIVWTDGQATLAKCGENDIWDPEKGLLVCIAKRMFVSGTQMNKWLKEEIPESEPVEKATEDIYKPKHAAE